MAAHPSNRRSHSRAQCPARSSAFASCSSALSAFACLTGEAADDNRHFVAGDSELTDELSVGVYVSEPQAWPHVGRELPAQVVGEETGG